MSVMEQAREFFEKSRTLSRDELSEATEALPKDVRKALWQLKKESYFDPKNEEAQKFEKLSDSGKYKIVISTFTTGEGSWHYSQGKVFRQGSEEPIAVVRRNYHSFPYMFLEGHLKGDFVVCGADYQGQTVINLITGERRDNLSEGTDKGCGFCWADYRFDPKSQILVVDGCHWACPYEYKFFDFSDPMSGWPELELLNVEGEGTCVYQDDKWPEFLEDGTIKVFQVRSEDEDDESKMFQGKSENKEDGVVAFSRFRRDGIKLFVVEDWVSDAEKERRAQQAENMRKYEEAKKHFKATDPLYLAYVGLVNDPALSPDENMGVGCTYDGWCPDFKGDERRWCRRIISHKGKVGYAADLEWAEKTGPIKLIIYKDGNTAETKFFGHSVDEMKAAFAYVKKVAIP